MQATRVFISYSHRDEAWKDHVRRFLDGLSGLQVTAWDDREIEPGSSWRADIDRAMQECHVALLLISQDFLNSNFIRTVEIPRLHARWQAKEVVVIPVLVRASHWLEHEWLKDLQGWPRDSALLGDMKKRRFEELLRQLSLEYVAQRKSPEPLPVTRTTPDAVAVAGTNLPPAKCDLNRLPPSGPDFFGRDHELVELDAALADVTTEIVVMVAPGGTGKSVLIRRWLDRLRLAGWRGLRKAFGWSFAAQGQLGDEAGRRQGSEDAFFSAAQDFFGIDAKPGEAAEVRGQRLAEAIRAEPALLILDGLEALQHPPGGDADDGALHAIGIKALLRALAAHGHGGLCVVTSRIRLRDLAAELRSGQRSQGSVRQHTLGDLPPVAGARLLYELGVRRAGMVGIDADDAELQALSTKLKGHALTLRFVGLYLFNACSGNVRRHDEIDFSRADESMPSAGEHDYRDTFAAMRAYEHWLAADLPTGLLQGLRHRLPGTAEADRRKHLRRQRQLQLLRLLSLFDYPAPPDCLRAVIGRPIDGLTRDLHDIGAADWRQLVSDLQRLGLVQVQDWSQIPVCGYPEDVARQAMAAHARGEYFPLDKAPAFPTAPRIFPLAAQTLELHPLLREYFTQRLAETPGVARNGHGQIFNYLSASVPYWPEGEAGLAPLYQAVAHGCRAGRYQEARAEVYRDRINRRDEFYATKKLGLYGTELSAVAHFFREPWRTPVAAPALADSDRAWLLNQAAFRLRALGRLTEAVEPMQAAVEMDVAQQDWISAASSANNLSELQQTLGALTEAIAAGEAAVRHADASGEWSQRMRRRAMLADARQQAGETAAALSGFAEAEALQGQWQPEYPRLYSLQGFRYCDALLQSAERTAWAAGTGAAVEEAQRLERLAELQAVEARAAQTLAWAQRANDPLSIALDHLTQARVSLYRSRLLAASDPPAAAAALQAATMAAGQAVDGLRKAGHDEFIVRGLLTRACVHSLNADADAARADLDEAQRIAERGGMKLHLADVHLHRARLFDDRTALAAARQLIDEIGYERRRDELDDAQCRLDGRAVVLPEFASVESQARGEPATPPAPATTAPVLNPLATVLPPPSTNPPPGGFTLRF